MASKLSALRSTTKLGAFLIRPWAPGERTKRREKKEGRENKVIS